MMTIEFIPFQKIGRLSRGCTITEKIDGTNASVFIGEDGTFLTGSRTRWITPEGDYALLERVRWKLYSWFRQAALLILIVPVGIFWGAKSVVAREVTSPESSKASYAFSINVSDVAEKVPVLSQGQQFKSADSFGLKWYGFSRVQDTWRADKTVFERLFIDRLAGLFSGVKPVFYLNNFARCLTDIDASEFELESASASSILVEPDRTDFDFGAMRSEKFITRQFDRPVCNQPKRQREQSYKKRSDSSYKLSVNIDSYSFAHKEGVNFLIETGLVVFGIFCGFGALAITIRQ